MKGFYASFAVLSAVLSSLTSARALYQRTAPADPHTDPYDDHPFYDQPTNINSFQPGQMIDNRTVTTDVRGNLVASYQLKYRTTDGQGKSVSTIATLWVPNKPRDPPSIFAYQYAEDAIQLDCAPSWAWVKCSDSKNGNITYVEGPIVVPWALGRGYYVIQPDAEGPNSTWLVGKMEGQAVLDAIRATINFAGLKKATTQAAMYGYSGGAHSTVWAAELSNSYAPDLNIVAASYGGTPVDLVPTFQTVNGGDQALLGGGALFGLANGYPTLENNFQSGANGLTTQGKALAVTLRSRNYCINSEAKNYKGVDFNTYFKGPLLQNQVLINITNRESLLQSVSPLTVPVPKFPRFQYHGEQDVTVPFAPAQSYVNEQCNKGANILFKTYPNQNHTGGAVLGLQPALDFVGKAFDGKLQTCTCGTSNCTG